MYYIIIYNNRSRVRYMYLGGGLRPARWRGCARCGGRALAAALPARHPAHRAFDARFVSSCRSVYVHY